MASSYTGLGTELMTTGENAGTWGTTTNTNLQIIEQISGGYTEQDIAGSADTTTLSVSDGSTGAVLGHRIIKFTGTITGNQIVTIPLDVQQMYVLVNGTSGAYTVQFKYASGSGSSVTFAATDKGTKIVYAAADHATNPNLVDSGISSTGAHDLDGNEFILDADADTSITADTDDQIDIRISGADDFQFTANTFTAQAGSTIAAQALTATTVTASGIVKTDDTTEATTTTDGSLQTDGGLSIAKDAVFGDDVKLLSDSAVLSFGADSDTTLTHTDGTGLTLNSANKLLFRDSALSISSSTDGQLDIDADTEVEIATTTLDLNGALDVSGASQFSSTITVGVDGTGYDVKFFGDTSGSFLLWDQSDDALELTDSSPIKIGDAADMQIYHDGSNSYITNSQGALKIATESSGIAVTIGHTTSEVTIADNLTVTGTLTLGSNAELTEAELEMLDGITAGTVAASKAVVVDSNKDAASFRNVTLTGELDAATLDISGNADIDGTTNLDAVDIDGAVQLDATFTVGADDQGYDVKLFGDTASAYMLWDTSADDLILAGAARIVVPDSGLVLGSTAVTTTAAEINLIDGGASTGTTAVADADGILTNDGGTMRLTTAATFKTYFTSGITASSIAADDIAAGDAAVTLGNGSTSADVTIDSGDDVVIDAAGGNVEFKDAGTLQLTLDMDGTAGEQIIQLGVNSDDLVFKQYDGTEVFRMEDGGYLNVSNSTASSSSTTGSAIFGGGIGVAADANIGDDLTLRSDSAVLGFGADNDTTLTHTDGTGLTLNSTNKLCFQDTGTYVASNADGDLDVVSDGTAVDSINVESAGGITLDAGTAASGIIYEDDGTEMLRIYNSSSDVIIQPKVNGKDIIFHQYDGTSVLEINDGAYASFTAAAVAPEATLTDGATISWNALTQQVAKVTLGGNRTLGSASSGVTGEFISLLVIQDGTGSRTLTWNAAYEFASDTAPTLTTTADLGDLFVFRYNGSKWLEVGRNQALTLS